MPARCRSITEGGGLLMITQGLRAYNPEQLVELLGDSNEAINEVLKIASDVLPRAAKRLCEGGLSTKEGRSVAHQLKGAALTAGAEELAHLAAELEFELNGDWTPRARTLVTSLPPAVRRFIASVAAYLHDHPVQA